MGLPWRAILFDRAIDDWRASYPGVRETWKAAASPLRPRMTGQEYFVQQFLLQGEFPTVPGGPPGPGDYGLSYEEYSKATVLHVVGATNWRGRIPVLRMLLLDAQWPFYYFAKRYWKNRLTVFTPRDVDYDAMWGEHWATTRAGVAAWQALTVEEKSSYDMDPEAKRRRISGYHLFMSRWFKGLI